MLSYAAQAALLAQWAFWKAISITLFPFSNLLLPVARFFYLVAHHVFIVPIILVFRIFIYGFVYLPLRPFLFLLEISLDPNDDVEVSLINLAMRLLPHVRFFVVTLVHYFMVSVLLGAAVGVGVGLNLSFISAVFSSIQNTPQKAAKRKALQNRPRNTLRASPAPRKGRARVKIEDADTSPLGLLPQGQKGPILVKSEAAEIESVAPNTQRESSPKKRWTPSDARHQYAYEDDDGYNYLASGDEYLASLEDYLVSAGESIEESPGPVSPTPLRLLDKQLQMLQTPERVPISETTPEMKTITEDDENDENDHTTPFSTINSTIGNTFVSHYDSVANTIDTELTTLDTPETSLKQK